MGLFTKEETSKVVLPMSCQLRVAPFLRRRAPRRVSEPVPNKANVEGSGTDSSLVVSPEVIADPSARRAISTVRCTVLALMTAPPTLPGNTPVSA
jgi:hypothetical protein